MRGRMMIWAGWLCGAVALASPGATVAAGGNERTALQNDLWCSVALNYVMARGGFDQPLRSYTREDAAAAIVYYDDLVAERAETAKLSVRETILMLNADRRRFITELEDVERDAEVRETAIVACVVIAKFTGDPLFDLGFGQLLD